MLTNFDYFTNVLSICMENAVAKNFRSVVSNHTFLSLLAVKGHHTCFEKVDLNNFLKQVKSATAYLLEKSQCVARQFVLFQFCCCLCAECKGKSSLIQCICIPHKVCGLDRQKKRNRVIPFPLLLAV